MYIYGDVKVSVVGDFTAVLNHTVSYLFDVLVFIAQVPVKPSCQSIVDVGFILDSSGSLRNDYGKEKDFLKVLAATFGVSDKGSRAGVITFSYYSEHSIKMNDHTDLSSFNAAVDKIPLMGSTTRIDKSLRLTQKEMFSLANGARPGIPKVLILLTDGSQTQDVGAEDPGDVADELRKDGINIIVVGIGQGVNTTELVHIAGDANNAYSATSFEELIGSDFVNKIKQSGCKAGKFISVCFVLLLFPFEYSGKCLGLGHVSWLSRWHLWFFFDAKSV